jgi:hypothetical protein
MFAHAPQTFNEDEPIKILQATIIFKHKVEPALPVEQAPTFLRV